MAHVRNDVSATVCFDRCIRAITSIRILSAPYGPLIPRICIRPHDPPIATCPCHRFRFDRYWSQSNRKRFPGRPNRTTVWLASEMLIASAQISEGLNVDVGPRRARTEPAYPSPETQRNAPRSLHTD